MKAKAKVSKELAGTDTKVQEAEFLEYASKNTATDEFDKLIGLAGEADASDTAAKESREGESKLPE
jgi:hypothetical protein